MTLVRTGGGVTDIRGGLGGVYFTRDKSGLHCTSKPRRVDQGTPKQQKQRKAFIKARSYTKDPRWVSYYIYRALNNLPFIFDAIVTGDPVPDCKGKYIDQGVYNERRHYKRADSAYFLWYWPREGWWALTDILGAWEVHGWHREHTIQGTYIPDGPSSGNPAVTLKLTPPPTDYQIPKL